MMSDPPNIPEYFEYDKKSFQIAKSAVSKIPTEEKVLEYLIESKPKFLKPADSMLGMDKQQLEKQVNGVADKLMIHCYPERSARLRYLYGILSKKFSENDDFLKMMTILLLEMSERPTSLLQLEVQNVKYSEMPDEDIIEENSISERELLKQILGDTTINDLVSYSSDSELSNWSDEDEEDESKKYIIPVPLPVSCIKPSHTFSDFSAITDEDVKRKEIADYWNLEAINAKKYWNPEHKSFLTPLAHQPVISGLLALHSKFGEYWEWKHAASHQSQRLIIKEDAMISEILCQFSILTPDTSRVFNSDWTLKSGLMTSSLTCEALSSFMLPVQNTLRSLATFKIYVQQIYQESAELSSSVSKLSVPPILLSYAHGLNDILNFISEEVQKLESNIKNRTIITSTTTHVDDDCGDKQPCTTLIQLINQIRPYIDCVETLITLHKTNFQSLNEISLSSSPEKDAVSCLNLLYSSFSTLNVQIHHPMKFGFLLYLFSKCLRAFLDEINSSLNLNWTQHLLFNRFPEVKISDQNFWAECIKPRHFEAISKQESIFSIPFFSILIDEMMIVLRTCEMIRQLNLDEECIKIIGHPPSSKQIVDGFLKLLIPSLVMTTDDDVQEQKQHQPEFVVPDLEPDYEKHFRFLGLENSLEVNSMKLIIEEWTNQQNQLWSVQKTTKTNNLNKSSLNNQYTSLLNLQIQDMPKINTWYALDTTLKTWYYPLTTKANHCIHKVFEDYSVDQSLQLFREIILQTREDFAQAVITLVEKDSKSNNRYNTWKEGFNPGFQKLLADCYPEGRENFDIDLKLDSTFDTKYTFVIKPHFPLNLVLFEDSIDGYLFVARQLSRIRKCLWEINALSIKCFKAIEGVEPNRMLLFRFAFLHFCSSFRAYLVFKVFGKDVNFCATSPNNDDDLIRRVHGSHLTTIGIELLKNPVIEKVILRKMTDMSSILQQGWNVGIPARMMVILEDTLKKCWHSILSFRWECKDFNELAYHFGPIPSYL